MVRNILLKDCTFSSLASIILFTWRGIVSCPLGHGVYQGVLYRACCGAYYEAFHCVCDGGFRLIFELLILVSNAHRDGSFMC
jgi:hypothetical protein